LGVSVAGVASSFGDATLVPVAGAAAGVAFVLVLAGFDPISAWISLKKAFPSSRS
jgi:hypothetical protein